MSGLAGEESVEEGLEAGLSMGEKADNGMSGDSDVTGGEGMGNRHEGKAGRVILSKGLGRRRALEGVYSR